MRLVRQTAIEWIGSFQSADCRGLPGAGVGDRLEDPARRDLY